MDKTQKPKVPIKIYKFFMHYETIVDWYYVEPGSKESEIFKSGWLPFTIPNPNHPFQKEEMRALEEKIKAIKKRKEVDWGRLRNFYFRV